MNHANFLIFCLILICCFNRIQATVSKILEIMESISDAIHPEVGAAEFERRLMSEFAEEDVRHQISTNQEQNLLRYLMQSYDKSVRPVYNASDKVTIAIGLTLTHIFAIEEKNQVLSLNVWLEHEWKDQRFKWDPKDFDGLHQLTVPARFVWTPDIVLYNNAEDFSGGIMQTNIQITPDGSIFWSPPVKFRSTCQLDVSYFPFDHQICHLRFASWIYDGLQVDITNRTDNVNQDSYTDHGEWIIAETAVKRLSKYYACCPDVPFPEIKFTLHLQRRTWYYMYNIIIPCAMLSFLTMMQFLLPCESGEKVTLGLTVVLAYSVFSFNITENMPETSDVIPLIAIYIMVIMSLASLSVTMSVIVLNMRHGSEHRPRAPFPLRFIAFNFLGPALCFTSKELQPQGGQQGRKSHKSMVNRAFQALSGYLTTMRSTEEHMYTTPPESRTNRIQSEPVVRFASPCETFGSPRNYSPRNKVCNIPSAEQSRKYPNQIHSQNLTAKAEAETEVQKPLLVSTEVQFNADHIGYIETPERASVVPNIPAVHQLTDEVPNKPNRIDIHNTPYYYSEDSLAPTNERAIYGPQLLLKHDVEGRNASEVCLPAVDHSVFTSRTIPNQASATVTDRPGLGLSMYGDVQPNALMHYGIDSNKQIPVVCPDMDDDIGNIDEPLIGMRGEKRVYRFVSTETCKLGAISPMQDDIASPGSVSLSPRQASIIPLNIPVRDTHQIKTPVGRAGNNDQNKFNGHNQAQRDKLITTDFERESADQQTLQEEQLNDHTACDSAEKQHQRQQKPQTYHNKKHSRASAGSCQNSYAYRRSLQHETLTNFVRRTRSSVHGLVSNGDDEMISLEWHTIARIFDQFFFWVITVFTLVTTVGFVASGNYFTNYFSGSMHEANVNNRVRREVEVPDWDSGAGANGGLNKEGLSLQKLRESLLG